MKLLTRTGYVEAATVPIGTEVQSYDTVTGALIWNTIIDKDFLTEQFDSFGEPLPIYDYTLNGATTLPWFQSVWVRDVANASYRIVHVDEVRVGDVVFDDANGGVSVTSVTPTLSSGGWRFHISGDHSFIADNVEVHNANRYWVGGGASVNWNATGNTNWGSASNTRDNASVPGSGDAVIHDNSANGASNGTVSAAITVGSLDYTGGGASNYAATLTHNASVDLNVAGNVKLSSAMTYTVGSATTSRLAFAKTGVVNFTSNGKAFPGTLLFANSSTAPQFTPLDDLSCANINATGSTAMVFNANGYNVTVSGVVTLSAASMTWQFGAGTWTLSGTGTVWNCTAGTITPSTSTISITNTSATGKTFAGGGKTYAALAVTGDNVTVTGNNTFTTVDNSAVVTNGLKLTSGTTTTCTSFISTSAASKLSAVTAGSAATLSVASGTVAVFGMSIKDSTASGGATFRCTNGTSVSGNTGWTFQDQHGMPIYAAAALAGCQ